MTKENKNMELWDSWCKTDPKNTKDFKGKGGFRGTAICAQTQIRIATQAWGPMGRYWGVKNDSFEVWIVKETTLSFGTEKACWLPPINRLVYRGTLYYPVSGEMNICGEIDMYTYSSTYKSWSINNDMYKKVSTDALTKGLSRLGMNSDVFEGRFDDNKYVQEMQKEFSTDKSGRPRASSEPQSGPPNMANAETVVM